MIGKTKNKLFIKQSGNILFVSLALGLTFGIFQIFLDLNTEKNRIRSGFQNILMLTHDTAAQASFQINENLSNQVTQGLISYPGIIHASLFDDFNRRLSESNRTQEAGSWFTHHIAFKLLEGENTFKTPLYVEVNERKLLVGNLMIQIDPIKVSSQFIERAIISFIFTLIQNFIFAAILIGLFYMTLSRPLLRISHWVNATLEDNKIIDTPPKHNTDDEIGTLISVFKRVWKERENAISQLQEYAYYDLLTGLANRRFLTDALNDILLDNNNKNSVCALIYIDLDRFKAINDSLGHSLGDALLVTVANRLKRLLDDKATVARLGGDEFVVFMPNISKFHIEAENIASKTANQILNALAEPHTIGGHTLVCTASLGIDILSNKQQHMQDVLRNADTALYKVKSEGGNKFYFFNESMYNKVAKRLAIEQGLHKAIEKNQLYIEYQSITDKFGNLVGAEAQLKWQHPEFGNLSSEAFIPVSEQSSSIIPITDWYIKQALSDLHDFFNQSVPSTFKKLSININPMQFSQSLFVEKIAQMLEDSECDAAHIELNLTEQCFYKEEEQSFSKLQALKTFGFSIALNGFGTGYTSLKFLKNDYFDTVIVDESMIKNIDSTIQDQIILESIVNMSERFKMNLIAEGIETQAELAVSIQLGCPCFQGDYFSRPLRKDLFKQMLFSS